MPRKYALPIFLSMMVLTSCGQVVPETPEEKACHAKSTARKIACFTELAMKTRDPIICDNIIDPGFRVICKKDIALKYCDTSVCDQIFGQWKQEGCRADVQQRQSEGGC